MIETPRPLCRAAAIILAATLGSAFAAADARAASIILTRPTTGPGITPVAGDPVYRYSFQAYLNPGYEIRLFDSITIEGIVGVNGASPTSQPQSPDGGLPADTGWLVNKTVTGTDVWPAGSPAPTVDVANVRFTFAPEAAVPPGTSIPNVGPGLLDLGVFTIDTYADLPDLGPGFEFTFRYVVRAHLLDGTPDTYIGFVTLGTAVAIPEPCSMLLLGLGVAAPAAWTLRRRRRAAA
ncbi:PEP-CTERM sorting domain-containing protein [Paludisphaera soli]|uniref:PEP-CTERM sorting domain-containing protein n=1 Tax=Paludisphaera soli TaxID=2712865 RepID=UPI0013EB6B0F|nr:PEP-CTERM sorting domain-containing protein [Paludisphaera soli]